MQVVLTDRVEELANQGDIPLFPLNTVLFPGGRLPLRIFEPRYLSMVSDCMRDQSPFGVVLIQDGNEAGLPASFHAVGTTCGIVDFDQLEDGTLGITGIGDRRFSVVSHGVEADNLIVARVQYLDEPDSSAEIESSAIETVSEFLRKILQREDLAEYRESLQEDWENSDWVSFQTAELFPMSPQSRQFILEMDVDERMQELRHILEDNKLVGSNADSSLN